MGLIRAGRKAVTTAGTPERLVATDTFADWLMVQKDNTAAAAVKILIGDVNVDWTEATRRGVIVYGTSNNLTPSPVFPGPLNLKDVWVEVSSDGSACNFLYAEGDHAMGQLRSGNKTIAAAGVAERLVAATTRAAWVFIQKNDASVGDVVVGGSDVVAAAGSRKGFYLPDHSSDYFDSHIIKGPLDLTDVWVDCTSNGAKVHFIYLAI